MNDAEFERILLQSARGDAPPDDARDAWLRLAGSLGAMGASPFPDGGRTAPEAAGHRTVVPGPMWPGSVRKVAMKWLVVGALGGSAATAAVMIRARAPQTSVPANYVNRGSVAPTKVASAPARLAAPDVTPPAVPPARFAPPVTRPRHGGRVRARASEEATGPKASASTLAAEVSRIDAARTANASGAYDEAIWLIERYHRDFPDGALSPDAEVVALEAVAAKRDGPETARRAALFLSRYPDDPHAARVKWLAEHRRADDQ